MNTRVRVQYLQTNFAIAIAIAIMLSCVHATQADIDGGYAALTARLGDAAPTGAGIAAVQIEGPQTAGGSNFTPDLLAPEFAGKNITIVNSPATSSWHATNVAMWLYGLNTSMAKGMNSVWVYNVNTWITGTLNVGMGTTLPAVAPSTLVRVMNHSWIGSFGVGQEGYDREAIRRMDYQMTRDGIVCVCGENNGAGSTRAPMMGDNFNGLSVGRFDLEHSAGDTGSASDTPGRMKPDMIASGQFTSFSTPVVGSAAALLCETLQSNASTASLSKAQKAQLAKIALLAGADRDQSWANNAAQTGASRGMATKPWDVLRGSGSLNVNRAHRIVTAERVNGASNAATATQCASEGWGTGTLSTNEKTSWRFLITRPAANFDFTITWPRVVATNLASYTLANMNLRMQGTLDGAASLFALEGDAGIGIFLAGNVASASAVDNVETIHLLNLQPGEYVVGMSRSDAAAGSVVAYAAWSADATAFGLLGDLDGSGVVDFGDVVFALLSFGSDDPLADLDHSGVVDFGDIVLILLNFG